MLLQGHTHAGCNYSSFSNPWCRTFLCRVHGGNRAERPLPSIIVSPHFHFERREGWDGVVPEGVAGRSGRGDRRSRPRDHPQRPECDDVAEALAVLQFLRNRLGAKHKTTVILKCIQTKKQTRPSAVAQHHSEWTQPFIYLSLFLQFPIGNAHRLCLSFSPLWVYNWSQGGNNSRLFPDFWREKWLLESEQRIVMRL